MESEVKKEFLSAMIALLAVIISLPITIIYGGYTISTLWAWFIVPLGVPAIGVAHALGFGTVVGYFISPLMKYVYKKAEGTKEIWTALVYSYAVPTLALLFGYLYHSFM